MKIDDRMIRFVNVIESLSNYFIVSITGSLCFCTGSTCVVNVVFYVFIVYGIP